MPRLNVSQTQAGPTVEFILSVPLDLMNAMYFTHLAYAFDGVEGWPVEVRKRMDPELLAELDFLYDFPNGQPGLMGQLGDMLWAHPETWHSVEALLDFVRNLPLGVGDSEANSGVQGLAFYLACIRGEEQPPMSDDPREALRLKITADGVEDVEGAIAVWDQPEELRTRMVNLIERFYEEHYREEIPNRWPAMERSVAEHRDQPAAEVADLGRQLVGRQESCLETYCQGDYTKYYFMPSVDVAPYSSCALINGTHGLIYPCEPRFIHDSPDADATARTARLYKALSDEGRLRILGLLREREMYAQEIVDRMGLHQSVVSRHLSFLKAVGLVQARKENNMKFFSINTSMRDELSRTLDLFAPTVPSSH